MLYFHIFLTNVACVKEYEWNSIDILRINQKFGGIFLKYKQILKSDI